MNDIFEALQEKEEKAFYDYTHNPTGETKAAHEAAKEALVSYAKRNGII